MPDRPRNYESILGSITRAFSKNNSGKNPLTRTWIGQEQNDLRQPIEKEQSQSPALPWYSRSSGTAFDWTQPVPALTDIRTRGETNSPGPDSRPTLVASSVGSLVQPMPDNVPLNNVQFSGYGMSPQNGDHFQHYFANQVNQHNITFAVNPANVLTAVSEQQNQMADGSADVWGSYNKIFDAMQKNYRPVTTSRGS